MTEPSLAVQAAVRAPLDPGLKPAALAHRAFEKAVTESGGGAELCFALERDAGRVSVFKLRVFEPGHPLFEQGMAYSERTLKFLLWQRGAHTVSIAGPEAIAVELGRQYSKGGARAFDAEFLAKVYEKDSFRVLRVAPEELPQAAEEAAPVGGHLDGCRIGFDAGGSDRKVAAVIDGKEVFSCEVVWHPKTNSDPQYHFQGIDDSIRRAAEHLPRIDAIGVSSAGIYVNNRTMVASLFRKIPEDEFDARVKTIYLDIAKKWGAVPIAVANDGDVTALAGAMSLKDYPVLGIAMGTSQASGYVNSQGLITGWLNELAFAPVDFNDQAPLDSEWSGDRGTGVNYFSQEAVIRLAPRAGIKIDRGLTQAEKLKQVQELMLRGDERARPIYETIGVYLGYGLLHYANFYELKHVLMLGRVTSGDGGNIALGKAREVLDREAPELSARLKIHLPDEATRRVGQSIAAASLPRTKSPSTGSA